MVTPGCDSSYLSKTASHFGDEDACQDQILRVTSSPSPSPLDAAGAQPATARPVTRRPGVNASRVVRCRMVLLSVYESRRTGPGLSAVNASALLWIKNYGAASSFWK